MGKTFMCVPKPFPIHTLKVTIGHTNPWCPFFFSSILYHFLAVFERNFFPCCCSEFFKRKMDSCVSSLLVVVMAQAFPKTGLKSINCLQHFSSLPFSHQPCMSPHSILLLLLQFFSPSSSSTTFFCRALDILRGSLLYMDSLLALTKAAQVRVTSRKA